MTSATFFSGIEGPELAADELGWEYVFSCEINPFGRHILSQKWPKAKHYEDITKTDFSVYRGRIDVLTGGFPCQPFSIAGERKGTEDNRHLWPEMLRGVRQIQPRWIVGENVRGLVNWNEGLVFEQVCADLEAEGYQVQPFILPAAGVGAPHRRERVFIIAHSCGLGYSKNKSAEEKEQYDGGRPARCEPSQSGQSWDTAHPYNKGAQGSQTPGYTESSREISEQHFRRHYKLDDWRDFPTQPPVRTRDDGFSTGALRQCIREDSMGLLSEKEIDKIFSKAHSAWAKESIAAGGNAIVPQVILQIFKAIEMYEEMQLTNNLFEEGLIYE